MSTWTVDNKRITLSAPIRSGTADCVCIGTAGDKRYLVTLSTRHPESYDELREHFCYDNHRAIAPLVYLGPTDDGCPFADALVEEISGRPATPLISVEHVRMLGAMVASVIESVHDGKRVLGGLRPELIYVGDDDGFVSLLPRGPQFAASAPMKSGLRTYAMPYMAPETLTKYELTAASDVFTLAASLWFLSTGAHPFGADVMDVVQNLFTNQRATWTGDETLGAALIACLAPSPSERPSARDLSQRLLEQVSEHHIHGEIMTSDWGAVANAVTGWADRCVRKEALLVDKGNLEAEIYGDGDYLLVSAVVIAETRTGASALLRELVERLERAGIESSLSLDDDD